MHLTKQSDEASVRTKIQDRIRYFLTHWTWHKCDMLGITLRRLPVINVKWEFWSVWLLLLELCREYGYIDSKIKLPLLTTFKAFPIAHTCCILTRVLKNDTVPNKWKECGSVYTWYWFFGRLDDRRTDTHIRLHLVFYLTLMSTLNTSILMSLNAWFMDNNKCLGFFRAFNLRK